VNAPLMRDHALEYAESGIPVFPCRPRGKKPLTEHGFKDATVDAATIRDWWSVEHWPDANIGTPTGISFDVCDVDTEEALRGLAALALGHDDPHGPVVLTCRGWHFYYAPTGIGNRVEFNGGCDWRGRGGYAIVPPSLHEGGAEYVGEPA
jgi:hypothetical protein